MQCSCIDCLLDATELLSKSSHCLCYNLYTLYYGLQNITHTGYIVHVCLYYTCAYITLVYVLHTCTVWVKKNTRGFLTFFSPKWFGIFSPTFTRLLYVPIYARLQIFIQLSATISATIQFTPYAQNFHHWLKCRLAFSDIFPKQIGIFSSNFTCLLHVPTYARLQFFIQLLPWQSYAILIATIQRATCVSADGGHFEHMMVVALNMA